MPTVRHKPDARKPFRLSPARKARLAAMTDAEIEAAAAADPDAHALTDDQLRRAQAARFVKSVRAHISLSQEAFAERYHINVARLRDWEQGRSTPDSAIIAYFKLIEHDPETAARVTGEAVG